MITRWGAYLLLTDDSGRRHLVRIASVQMASDADVCQDMTVLIVAGRPIAVPVPLDDVLDAMVGRDAASPP